MTLALEGRLVIPSPMYSASIRDYLQACAEIQSAVPWDPEFDSDDKVINDYINNLSRGYWSPSDKQDGSSPVTHFWYVVEGNVVGRCSLRNKLVGTFGESHGHIGYDIHPHFRQRGFGSHMLAALLEVAKKRDMHSLLITCHPDNIASRRMIENCGGICRDLYANEYLRFDVHL